MITNKNEFPIFSILKGSTAQGNNILKASMLSKGFSKYYNMSSNATS